MPYPWGGVMPQPQMFQPQFNPAFQYQTQQPQAPKTPEVAWVSTMDEVNGANVGLGESKLFMFTGENTFAVKSVAANGIPSIKVFDFHERQPVTPASYVTREEFDQLKEQINGKPVVPTDPGTAAITAVNGFVRDHTNDAGVPGDTTAGAAGVL